MYVDVRFMIDTYVRYAYIVANTTGETQMLKVKQSWEIGQIVKVGFVQRLVVKEKVATPGDHRPDGYVLWQPETNRWYSFQPHHGLTRHDNAEQARGWF